VELSIKLLHPKAAEIPDDDEALLYFLDPPKEDSEEPTDDAIAEGDMEGIDVAALHIIWSEAMEEAFRQATAEWEARKIPHTISLGQVTPGRKPPMKPQRLPPPQLPQPRHLNQPAGRERSLHRWKRNELQPHHLHPRTNRHPRPAAAAQSRLRPRKTPSLPTSPPPPHPRTPLHPGTFSMQWQEG